MRPGVRRLAVVAISSATFLAVTGAGAASEPRASESDDPTAPLTAGSGGPGALAFSPAGCVGTTYPPTIITFRSISATAITACNYAVLRVMVEVTLYRERWYGLERLAYDQQYSAGSPHTSAWAEWYGCRGEHTYHARSNHESLEGGTYYTATTASQARKDCG
jgi:hypothetical protein